MNWKQLGIKIDANLYRAAIRSALAGQTKTIRIGRSANTRGVCNATPIEIIEGNNPPSLRGLPFLKTTFRRGNFRKMLYTPSTLHVVVGRDWK